MNINGWSKKDAFKIVKNFKPVDLPLFDGKKDAYGYVQYTLYNRIRNAISSFIVLFENERYFDAFIIAGHMLETCAVFSYIKDGATAEIRREKYNRFVASSAMERLITHLKTGKDLYDDMNWRMFVCLLKIFYPVGAFIIENKKENQDEKSVHEECISRINCRLGKNEEKIKLIKKYYKPVRINEYMTEFSLNVGKFDDGEFEKYYTKYCNFKHSNILNFGISFEDIDGSFSNEVANDVLFLILGIVMYLQRSEVDFQSETELFLPFKRF